MSEIAQTSGYPRRRPFKNWVWKGLLLGAATSVLLGQTPISFQYFYDDLNQLVKVVDSTGVVVSYVYDPVGNIQQIVRSTVAPGALTIFNITPQTVTTGGTITIQGQGFSSTPSANTVLIGRSWRPILGPIPKDRVVATPER